MTRLEKQKVEVESEFVSIDLKIRNQRYWNLKPATDLVTKRLELVRKLDKIESALTRFQRTVSV